MFITVQFYVYVQPLIKHKQEGIHVFCANEAPGNCCYVRIIIKVDKN